MTRLWCIHGNLQQPSTWQFLREALNNDVTLELVDLWLSEATGFWNWASTFCETVQAYPKDKHVLLGYSLGGRLALHALLTCPKLWSGALIVVADSGLANPEERSKRLVWDQAWGERFLNEDWSALLTDWDAQAVFANRPNTSTRSEEAFSRQAIARSFDVFSKGRQDDLLPQLKTLSAPSILYVSGEEDAKYSAVGELLAQECPALSNIIMPDAAHRVPWENQVAFIKTLKSYLDSLT